jgi:hypothetical protein
MKLARALAIAASLVASFGAGYVFNTAKGLAMSKTAYVKTSEPLLLSAEGESKYYYLLPPNTPMYRDQSYPEGHTRYIVYVNIKSAFASQAVESDKPNLIDPIWAYTLKKDDIRKLVSDVPLSKDDLVSILKARKMTREDLADIVREWTD